MKKSKLALIIAASVLDFLYMAGYIYGAVLYFIAVPTSVELILLGIYMLVSGLSCGIAGGLLIYSIAGGGRHFRARNGFYMTGFVLTLAFNLISLATLLLVFSMFISDWVWIKPVDDVYFKKEEVDPQLDEKARDQKIASLRKLRDEGKITEEEFQQALFKLL